MKILRLTRHPATPEQVEMLRAIYGDVEIVEVAETVPDVARVRALVSEHNADVLEAVLPLPLLAAAVDPRSGVGIPVIRAVMRRELAEDGSATFRCTGYERVVRISIETEPLGTPRGSVSAEEAR